MQNVHHRRNRSRRTRTCGAMTAALAALLTFPAVSNIEASDYSNTCKSGDGQYVMDDGALYRATDKERSSSLTYAILEQQVLSRRAGHCIAKGPGAADQKYDFEWVKSRILVEIDTPCGQQHAKMTCELASDGMPAAFQCGREVLDRTDQSPGPNVRYAIDSPGVWIHTARS